MTIAGDDVGGLTQVQATDAIQTFFDRRIMVHLGARTVGLRPEAIRARGRVFLAVRDALAAAPGTAIPLQVIVNENAIRGWVNTRAKFFRRAPVSTRAVLSGLTPHLTKPKDGRELMTYYGRRKVVAALRSHDRDVTMPWRALKPTRTPSNHGPVVVIQRGSKRLVLYRGTRAGAMNAVASFGVATGMAAYPTPTGNFRIATRQRNPWWYPPAASWARRRLCRPARARQPARDPLDGPERGRRRDPRDARRGLDRLLGLPRLHPHADLRRRVALRARARRHAGLHPQRLGHRPPPAPR